VLGHGWGIRFCPGINSFNNAYDVSTVSLVGLTEYEEDRFAYSCKNLHFKESSNCENFPEVKDDTSSPFSAAANVTNIFFVTCTGWRKTEVQWKWVQFLMRVLSVLNYILTGTPFRSQPTFTKPVTVNVVLRRPQRPYYKTAIAFFPKKCLFNISVTDSTKYEMLKNLLLNKFMITWPSKLSGHGPILPKLFRVSTLTEMALSRRRN